MLRGMRLLLLILLKLKESFIAKFGSAPKFYVRAPGRVNLIGEHIDYCGYAVLPMAIEQDILIAVEPVKTEIVQLANINSSYLDFSTSVNNIQINKTKPQWHNYFLCGLKGIQEHFGLNNPTGMNCLLDGTIPPSSGLSSSSALVCCAGLVTLKANGKTLSKELLLSAARYFAPVMKKRATHLQMRIPSSQHRSSQECIQGFMCLDRHRRRLHHFFGQPVPVLHHSYRKEVLQHVYMEILCP